MQNNFCINCGAKIVHNSNFCFNCGTPVASVNTKQIEINMESAVESSAVTVDSIPAVEFQVLGRTLSFSSDLVEYNKLRTLFSNHASKSKSTFFSYYQSNVKSFNDLFDKAIPTFIEMVTVSLKFGVSVLIKYDVDYVDLEKLADLATNEIDILKYISHFIEASDKIAAYAENLSSYRNLSRAERGNWQGGGFGLSGAIKGALTASVLNVGTGMVRGIGDSLTNAGDRAKIAGMKNDFFTDHQTLALLTEGVHECCFGVFYSVWRILEDEHRIPTVEFEIEKLNARANNLIAQYTNDKTLYNRVIDVLCDCIRNYPYSVSYFSNLYFIAKDSKEEILETAKYFGLETEYKEAISNLNQVEYIRQPIDEAIRNGNLEYVWAEIESGNSYAEYGIEKYYGTICHDCIKTYNVLEMTSLLGDVQKRANSGNIYAQYLMAKMECDMYGRDRRNLSKETEAAKVVIEIAAKGNISAIALQGFWGSRGYHNATKSEDSAIALLEEAANRQHPTALAWLGSYYRTGERGLSRNKEKAGMMLKLAAAYDHPYGKKELEKFNSGSTSSCYITTAVCDSLGREDDGYELTAFRSFRDNWLVNQVDGEILIKEYYSVAPVLVDHINAKVDRDAIYKRIWDEYLKECLIAIESGYNQRCKEIYCRMVNNLKTQYL
ncbi:CFI-box-CTERM domain-containing protein [Paenibacillus sp. MMO-58]|uniref:CFI-box-CTERM domain-containing protein n=1 Tax=Paenibacillus sp. MMO-58 TaxID=3081290 RepID=UPI0030198BA0